VGSFKHFSQVVGLDVKVEHKFACEKDEQKRSFIMSELNPERIFIDIGSLSERLAYDSISNQRVRVPLVDVFLCGFSCKSRTSMSSRASQNINCVQKQDTDTETGYTFDKCFRYICKASPSWILLENVRALTHISDESAISDAEWICQQLRQIGYVVEIFVFDCLNYGSIQSRIRLYILAWIAVIEEGRACDLSAHKDKVVAAQAFWKGFPNYFVVPSLPVESFLVLDIEDLLRTGRRISTMSVPVSTASSKEKWRSDHIDAFRTLDLSWPVELPTSAWEFKQCGEPPAGFKMMRGCLTDRAAELAFFLMVKFPCVADPPVVEFVDVNPSMPRLCQDDESNPWRQHIPTITGEGHIVLRYRLRGYLILRPLFGFEAFHAIGWGPDEWVSGPYPDAILTNLVGNAFSGFALLPMLMVLSGMEGSLHLIADCPAGIGTQAGEASPASVGEVVSSDDESS